MSKVAGHHMLSVLGWFTVIDSHLKQLKNSHTKQISYIENNKIRRLMRYYMHATLVRQKYYASHSGSQSQCIQL